MDVRQRCSGFLPSAVPAVRDGPRGAFDCFSASVGGCWSVVTLAPPPTPQISATRRHGGKASATLSQLAQEVHHPPVAVLNLLFDYFFCVTFSRLL